MNNGKCPRCSSKNYLHFIMGTKDRQPPEISITLKKQDVENIGEMRLCTNCGYKIGESGRWIIDYIPMTMEEYTKKLKEEYKI